MSSEHPDSDEEAAESDGPPRECMPCRGSGQVISNLGGSASVVPCPWCRGSGTRLYGIDAQAKWLNVADGEGPAAA